jgi:AcrR family transcriptional regulator
MSQGVHRPKRPELVKALLLDACAQQLLSGGPLSIGVVADIAGVTKGAVQHHFPTREDLVHALYDHLAEEFQAQVADDGSGASAAWRYARIALQGPCADSAKRQGSPCGMRL